VDVPFEQSCPKSQSKIQSKEGGDPYGHTPELSYRGSATLRRLAWFRGKPMAETIETLLEATGRTMAAIRSGEVFDPVAWMANGAQIRPQWGIDSSALFCQGKAMARHRLVSAS